MKLLAFDTSTDACTCALVVDGDVLCDHRIIPRQHADELLGMIQDLLASAECSLHALDAVAFGRGPGAFTGLRIAAGVAQGLCFGSDVPGVPVSTLQTLAQGAYRERGVTSAIAGFDARIGDVYIGAYTVQDGIALAVADEVVCRPLEYSVPAREPGDDNGVEWTGLGSAFDTYASELAGRIGSPLVATELARLPMAEDTAVLGLHYFARGEVVSAEAIAPIYLRNDVAKVPGAPAVVSPATGAAGAMPESGALRLADHQRTTS